MKIGVALSGCDIGGVGAFAALDTLETMGLELGMISACGLAAVTALPFSRGRGAEECAELAARFLDTVRLADVDTAVAELATSLSAGKTKERVPLTIGAVNVADGAVRAFTNAYSLKAGELVTFPLEDAYDALSATISPMDGLGSYPCRRCRLCDFSVWYGSPVQPLRMNGIDRIVSVAFLPESPATPYEALVKQKIEATSPLADHHIAVTFRGPETAGEYIAQTTALLLRRREEIYTKLLF